MTPEGVFVTSSIGKTGKGAALHPAEQRDTLINSLMPPPAGPGSWIFVQYPMRDKQKPTKEWQYMFLSIWRLLELVMT